MIIRESAEDYLESILILYKQNGFVRSIDIVNRLGYSKPSISVAMKRLRENGYIKMDSSGYITLTDDGREIAEKTYERHVVISTFLMDLGVSRETAMEDACRIEHVISEETFEKLKHNFYQKK